MPNHILYHVQVLRGCEVVAGKVGVVSFEPMAAASTCIALATLSEVAAKLMVSFLDSKITKVDKRKHVLQKIAMLTSNGYSEADLHPVLRRRLKLVLELR
jgi:hypothetical protein